MTAAGLLNQLSNFESLIVMKPEALVAKLGPALSIFCQAGRFIILLMFILFLVQKVVTNQAEDLKKNIAVNAMLLVVFMAIFGTYTGYSWFSTIMMNIYNLFAQSFFISEMTSFKGKMRLLIDTIAESGKYGVDFFNVKAMAANVLAFLVSACIYLMIVTYYIFASVGMFFILVAIATGPIMAGFFFFIKTPLHNWLCLVFASMIFPVFAGIAVVIVNQTPLLSGLRQDIMVGSMMTILIQILMMILFMQFVIIFHAGIFGVSVFNLPVKILGIVQVCCGVFDQAVLNNLMIRALKRKRS